MSIPLINEGSPVSSTPSVIWTLPSMPLNIMAICSTHNVLKDRDIYFLNREIFQIRYFLVAFCVNNFPFLPNDKLLNDDRVMKILKIISYRWNDYKQLEYKHELRKKKKREWYSPTKNVRSKFQSNWQVHSFSRKEF